MLIYLLFTIIKQITHMIIGFINTLELSTKRFNIKYCLPLICLVGILYYTQKENCSSGICLYSHRLNKLRSSENSYLFDYIMYELISSLLMSTFIGIPMISTIKKDTNHKIDLILTTISNRIDELKQIEDKVNATLKSLSIKQYKLNEMAILIDNYNQTLNEMVIYQKENTDTINVSNNKIDETNKILRSFSTKQNKLTELVNTNISFQKENNDIIEQKLSVFSQMFTEYDKTLTYNNELMNKYNKTLSQFTVKPKKNNVIDLTDDTVNVVTVEIEDDKEKKIRKKTICDIIERFSDVVKDTEINRHDVITIKKNLHDQFA